LHPLLRGAGVFPPWEGGPLVYMNTRGSSVTDHVLVGLHFKWMDSSQRSYLGSQPIVAIVVLDVDRGTSHFTVRVSCFC
jgi:hypothetical protein